MWKWHGSPINSIENLRLVHLPIREDNKKSLTENLRIFLDFGGLYANIHVHSFREVPLHTGHLADEAALLHSDSTMPEPTESYEQPPLIWQPGEGGKEL